MHERSSRESKWEGDREGKSNKILLVKNTFRKSIKVKKNMTKSSH